MKTSAKGIISLLALFLFFLFPVRALAQSSSSVKQQIVILGKGEKVDRDYFAAGNNVIVDGTVNGDAFIAGGQVDVNGTINGDLLVAGGQIIIRGNVTQNVRAVGGNILIEGNVGRNVALAGGNLTVDRGATIGGNFVAAGGNIDLLSAVKNFTVAGGSVALQSAVSGEVKVVTRSLHVFPGASVGGDLTYWSDSNAEIAPDAKVVGKTVYNQTKFKTNLDKSTQSTKGIFSGASLFLKIISFLSSVIVGLLLLKLVPVYAKKTTDFVSGKFWVSLLVGFITLVVAPVLAILLMITLVGIPIALATLFAYAAILYISKVFVAVAIGDYIARLTGWHLSTVVTFIMGLLLYYLVGFIPVLGFFVRLIVVSVGTGAIVLAKKEYFTTLRKEKLI